ncbi:ATP-dependent DNA helicase [Kovacikia minuta CCNUW1]|uniref:RecQ family ATP-dependent DNA helicase n=1 Tax=Kovacikia minuta TaxID=2931930 RepID=UPI001CCCC66E|nr:ATP-dependent DNA helicase RecQ [Kovacikia minuta]UBF25842.1 ATP-dependent DNA helicase [Kovacikia minuta CCNUW1]
MQQPAQTEIAIRAKLQQIWGYQNFRPPQGEIVDCLLNQRDALIIMPTGGGKSICFQLPALLQTGLTLVVSPLVALMENQVQELHQRDPAFQRSVALLHSELSGWQRKQILRSLEQQKLRLLYLSPETLLSQPVWERLCQPDLQINGLILDEAHCLSQWGDTFRPAYYRLGAVRSALLKNKPEGSRIAIAAFTATADSSAQQTIQRILQLQEPEVFRLNPYRSNLALSVQVVWTPRGRRQQLLQFIQTKPNQSGLVYVRTRRDSEALSAWLTQQGYRTAPYHAGLSPDQRRQIEQAWIGDAIQFVVCTCAFGMGINKSNVRWVIHFHAPSLLSEYVQEVGRAGRDGKPAVALTLMSETTGWLDSEDKQRWQFFETQAQKQQQIAQQLAKKLPAEGEVGAIARQYQEGALALSWLHGSGQLRWQDPFHYSLLPKAAKSLLGESNKRAVRQMPQYLKTRNCRWKFLLTAFGFPDEASDLHCGHCDNCNRTRTNKIGDL